jgi:hypothetical protein
MGAKRFGFLAVAVAIAANAEPVAVRYIQGSLHGFLIIRDMNNRLLASGDSIQIPAGNRITEIFSLHFRDGSEYEERAVFSQRRTFQLLSYRLRQKGPSFKMQQTLWFDTSTGKVSVRNTDEHGKQTSVDDHILMPADLANGMFTTLLTNLNAGAEHTLSMLVASPKPRIVKVKISSSGQDTYFVGAAERRANHFIVDIQIGGITGLAAKLTGKQPPPVHVWVSEGQIPVFLKSEGPLYEDGPAWRVELAGPEWSRMSAADSNKPDVSSSRKRP